MTELTKEHLVRALYGTQAQDSDYVEHAEGIFSDLRVTLHEKIEDALARINILKTGDALFKEIGTEFVHVDLGVDLKDIIAAGINVERQEPTEAFYNVRKTNNNYEIHQTFLDEKHLIQDWQKTNSETTKLVRFNRPTLSKFIPSLEDGRAYDALREEAEYDGLHIALQFLPVNRDADDNSLTVGTANTSGDYRLVFTLSTTPIETPIHSVEQIINPAFSARGQQIVKLEQVEGGDAPSLILETTRDAIVEELPPNVADTPTLEEILKTLKTRTSDPGIAFLEERAAKARALHPQPEIRETADIPPAIKARTPDPLIAVFEERAAKARAFHLQRETPEPVDIQSAIKAGMPDPLIAYAEEKAAKARALRPQPETQEPIDIQPAVIETPIIDNVLELTQRVENGNALLDMLLPHVDVSLDHLKRRIIGLRTASSKVTEPEENNNQQRLDLTPAPVERTPLQPLIGEPILEVIAETPTHETAKKTAPRKSDKIFFWDPPISSKPRESKKDSPRTIFSRARAQEFHIKFKGAKEAKLKPKSKKPFLDTVLKAAPMALKATLLAHLVVLYPFMLIKRGMSKTHTPENLPGAALVNRLFRVPIKSTKLNKNNLPKLPPPIIIQNSALSLASEEVQPIAAPPIRQPFKPVLVKEDSPSLFPPIRAGRPFRPGKRRGLRFAP